MTEIDMNKAGFFIVTLKGSKPRNIYGEHNTRSDKGTYVSQDNIKFGTSSKLNSRKKKFEGTFGKENICFIPLFNLFDEDQLSEFKKRIGEKLLDYRMVGKNGLILEWTHGITKNEILEFIHREKSAMSLRTK